MRRWAPVVLVAALLVLTACGGGDDGRTDPTPEPSPDEPTAAALEWTADDHPMSERVVVGDRWTAVADETSVTFEGPGGSFSLDEDRGGSVDSVFIDGDTAVVSYGFGGETMQGLAYRIDLDEQSTTEIVSPRPANGGAWALFDDSLHYPTFGEGGAYCLATLAVTDGNGEDGWCAPPRTGFSSLTASEHGVALMTFDDARPVSCRTPMVLDATGDPEPVEEATDCKGWDVAATSTGAIWSEVPREQRQEEARFHAVVDGEVEDLGPGTTGTLVPCGGDTFFVRDPRRDTDPARLMWWDGTGLSVAFESASTGNVFLGQPECADGILTVSEYGESGDARHWARVRASG